MDKSDSGLAKEEAALELPTAALAARAQLWNSLFGEVWLKPMEIKKDFSILPVLGWARDITQRAQGGPAKRKAKETNLNCRSRVPQRNTF